MRCRPSQDGGEEKREKDVLGWLRRLRPARPPPEARWTVAVDDESIRVTDEAGATRTVAKSALERVAVETNGSGPWGADFWWLLFAAGEEAACFFPLGATGEAEAVAYLKTLPGFDRDQLAEAVRSTRNSLFPLWSRGP